MDYFEFARKNAQNELGKGIPEAATRPGDGLEGHKVPRNGLGDSAPILGALVASIPHAHYCAYCDFEFMCKDKECWGKKSFLCDNCEAFKYADDLERDDERA